MKLTTFILILMNPYLTPTPSGPQKQNIGQMRSGQIRSTKIGQIRPRPNRDEPTGSVDFVTRRGDRDEWTIGVNNCHMTLATIGACGRQHKGVVSLVLAGPTPGIVVRRQERFRHSTEIIQCAELAERCPMTTRHLVTRVKQQRLPDSYESQTCDLKLPYRRIGAIHKSTSSAREKPTKVNVDDEGRSGVRWRNGLTLGVAKGSRPEEERMCHTFCVMKQTEYGEREDGSACGKVSLEESKQSNWAVAKKALTSGHDSEQVMRYGPQ